MIEKFLKDYGKEHIKDMKWSMNYRTLNNDTAVVYYEGSDSFNLSSELQEMNLLYQIEVTSYDFNKAFQKAFEVFYTFDKIGSKMIEVDFDKSNVARNKHYLHMIQAESAPIRVGVFDDRMIYTINFKAFITPYCD